MRAIADRAGASLGSSYHYFPSKEHLVLEFYRHTHELHAAAIAPLLVREKDLAARLRACEEENVRVSLGNLMTFPWISAAVATGALTLHGAYFDVRYGVLFVLQPDGSFAAVDEAPGS